VAPSAAAEPSRQPWRQRLEAALRGFKRGFRGQSSFFVFFFYGMLSLAAGIVLRCEILEWSLLIVCFTIVVTAELLKSAVTVIVNGLSEPASSRARPALEIVGAASLIAGVAATGAGILVFVHRLLLFLG
jgi:diacylglycerol kinase